MSRNPFIFRRGKVPISREPIEFTFRWSRSLKKTFRTSIRFIIATGFKPIFFFPAWSRPRTVLVQGRQVMLESTNLVHFLFRHTSYPLLAMFISNPLPEVVWPATHSNRLGRVPFFGSLRWIFWPSTTPQENIIRETSFHNLDFLCLLSSHSQIYFFNQILWFNLHFSDKGLPLFLLFQ